MYMDKELMEDKLYQIIDKFNKRKIRFTKSHLIVLNKIQPFIMMSANGNIIRQNI